MVPGGAVRTAEAGSRCHLIQPTNRETTWTVALNAPIYLISILPGLGVGLLAHPADNALAALVWANVAVILVQHAINVLNDAADWRLGADVEKFDSWVRAHAGDIPATLRHGWLSLAAGGLAGVLTLVRIDRLWILAVALPLVTLGYRYNSGARPLSYTRLGEWVTGLCYGPGVFGCLWFVTGDVIRAPMILGCIAFAALAVALLLSHQPLQIRTDRHAGKLSFAVRYGAERTYRTVRVLFLVFLTAWGLAVHLEPRLAMGPGLFVLLAGLALAGSFTGRLGPRYLLLRAAVVIAASAGSAWSATSLLPLL